MFALTLALVLAVSAGSVAGVNVEGTITTPDDVRWAFISSFCFDTAGLGKMWWQIKPNITKIGASTGYELLIFDDEPKSFPTVWPMRDATGSNDCQVVTDRRKNKELPVPFGGMISMEEFKDTNSGHQWFIAVSGCEYKSLNFKYNITFENSDSKDSAELGGIIAPTVFYAIFLALSIAALVLITLRAGRSGLGMMSPMIHRHAALATFMMLIANICAWAWAGNHLESSISAMLFFQGLQEFIMMWCVGFLAVANKTLDGIGKIVSYVFFGLAPLYFIFYFVMGLLTDPFPGVAGATVFSNGVSIVASIIRAVQALAWVGMLFLSWRANKHQGGTDQMHVLQWFVFGFAVFMWLIIMPIGLWANYSSIYSCSPPSLVAGYAVAAIFDGCIMVLMLIALDPAISQGVFGDILGSASLLTTVMPFKWNGMDWSTSGSGYQSGGAGYSNLAGGGISSDDFGDASSSNAGGASSEDTAQQSYQTL